MNPRAKLLGKLEGEGFIEEYFITEKGEIAVISAVQNHNKSNKIIDFWSEKL